MSAWRVLKKTTAGNLRPGGRKGDGKWCETVTEDMLQDVCQLNVLEISAG